MRILFVPWPGSSHLYPVAPLAWSFQGAGHEVRVASHASISAGIAGLGLTPVPIGDPAVAPTGPIKPYPEEQEARFERDTELLGVPEADRDPWDIFRFFMVPGMWDYLPPEAGAETPHPGVDDLVAFCQAWRPDLVIWDPCMPAAAIAARACGAAHVRLLWWQDYFGWTMDRWAEAGLAVGDDPLSRMVRSAADRHGVQVDSELLLGQWTLDMLPNGYRLPTSTCAVPLRWVLSPARAELPDWVDQPLERPRVALSLGMSQRDFVEGGWDHVPAIVEALGELDVDAVATLDAQQLDGVVSLPDNVRAVDYLPLDQLLPSCTALIHQGGFGTWAGATAARVPQLITDAPALPVFMKYPVAKATAAYVESRGAGLTLDIEKPDPDAIAETVSRALSDDSYARGADRLHDDWSTMPGPAEVVPRLEGLVAECGRTARPRTT